MRTHGERGGERLDKTKIEMGMGERERGRGSEKVFLSGQVKYY